MKESAIQKIIDLLKLKGYLVFKQSTGAYIPLAFGEKGISDIMGVHGRDGLSRLR